MESNKCKVLRLRQQAEHMQGSERSSFQGVVDNSCMRVVLGPHDNMNWESLCKLLFCCWCLCITCFRTSGDTEQATGSASDRYGPGKKRDAVKGVLMYRADSIKKRDVASESSFYSSFFFFPPRKTRRADIVVSAARTEPVPGAWGAGAPRLSEHLGVSGGSDRR